MIIDGFQYTQVPALPETPFVGQTVYLAAGLDDLEPGVYTYNGVEWASGTGSSRSAKDPVRAASTENIAILFGLLTLDGVDMATDDRALIKNQDNPAENGIYTVVADGPWKRSTDCDADKDFLSGMIVMIQEGTTNADTGWVFTSDGEISVGTDAIHWSQFSGTGNISAGAGLQRIGSTILLASTGVTPGTYKRLSVDAQGRVTSGDNPNTLLGMGITDGQTIVTGAASSVTQNDLLPGRVAGTDANGKLTDTELTVTDLLAIQANNAAVSSAVANKEEKVTGAATSILTADLAIEKALVSNDQGKVSVSTVTLAELEHLSGVSAPVQTQLDGKLGLTGGGTVAGAVEFTDAPVTPTGVVRKQDLDLAISGQQVIPRSTFASLPGNIVPFQGTLRWYPPVDSHLSLATAFAGTAPGTTPIEIDIKKNGTSIIPEGEQLLIGISQNESNGVVLPQVELLRTDYLTIDVINGDGADGGVRIDYSAIPPVQE